MQNGINATELEYTMLMDNYRGYSIEWAITPSRSETGKWMGHYRALKREANTVRASIANLFDNPASAQNETIRIAKLAVDGVVDSAG